MDSGGTLKVSARPFFASAIVIAPTVCFGAGASTAGAGKLADSGIGSHFKVEGSIPNSSNDEYFTGFR